ncbi:hypothetical protein QA541_02965 [Macrococcus psychrotolerans]|uniref:HTH luxR-type domain-containing protein n=1 Tax=Macrococcus psychrotolerans TaxID=3039389 RepID=A0AAU6RBP0_9STAP
MASCEREALKNYISGYHKGQVQQRRPMQQLDVYDLDIDDTDFYTIDDVSEHSIDEAAQHYEQACNVGGMSMLRDKVYQLGTDREIHVFNMMLQGRTVNEMCKVFDKSRSTIDNYINSLLDKVIEG